MYLLNSFLVALFRTLSTVMDRRISRLKSATVILRSCMRLSMLGGKMRHQLVDTAIPALDVHLSHLGLREALMGEDDLHPR